MTINLFEDTIDGVPVSAIVDQYLKPHMPENAVLRCASNGVAVCVECRIRIGLESLAVTSYMRAGDITNEKTAQKYASEIKKKMSEAVVGHLMDTGWIE